MPDRVSDLPRGNPHPTPPDTYAHCACWRALARLASIARRPASAYVSLELKISRADRSDWSARIGPDRPLSAHAGSFNSTAVLGTTVGGRQPKPMNRDNTGDDEATTLQIERRTEAVHAAMDGALLGGWDMSRSDMTDITLTHNSGETIDVTYRPAVDEWTVESDTLSLRTNQRDVVMLSQEEMSRIGGWC